jgi:indole-3-glycerol phosphate synthase
MNGILGEIVSYKRRFVEDRKVRLPLRELERMAFDVDEPRGFEAALRKSSTERCALIAEIKTASPSKGIIRDDVEPFDVACAYERNGAACISVLTDERFFHGSLDRLKTVRAATTLPILRKDFIIDPCQVYQSRAARADAILLIVAILSPARLLDLAILATELRMTVLVEVHTVEEILQVRSLVGIPLPRYALLGINNRDLNTFQTDIRTTTRMAELADLGDRKLPIVSESGIQTPSDVALLAAAGVKAILVGETFMRQQDIPAAVEALLGPAA